MLKTRFTEMFGLEYPVISAPMAMHSGGTLAAAVSKAGGLGSFGGVHVMAPGSWVTEQIEHIRSETDRAFAVGYITNFIPMFEDHFNAAIEARVPAIALSFGDPKPWAEKAKASGAKVICQVQTFEGAQAAVDAGTEVLVVQGNESGGHTGTMNLLPFLSRVADRYPDLPLLAAGGIADGRSLASVLAAGADGAWIGTAFLATREAVEVPDGHKQLIVESDGQDTVFSRSYDVASGLPWPDGVGHRVRRNRFTEQWEGRLEEIPANREKLQEEYIAAKQNFDPEVVDVAYGQGAGAVDAVRPAADVLRAICDDAERILRESSSSLA